MTDNSSKEQSVRDVEVRADTRTERKPENLSQEAACTLSSTPRDECPHGALRRQCDRCEMQAEIERLTRERDDAIKYRDDEFALRDCIASENTRLRAALQGLMAEVDYAISSGRVPVSWTEWDPPDLALVNARKLLQRLPDETFVPTGAGGNPRAFVCCEGVGQHAPGCNAVNGNDGL